jgi:hypothetical protein
MQQLVRRRRRMTRHPTLSKSKVKAAIAKILARREPLIPPMRFSRRRNLGKQLASALAEAGIDVSKLGKITSDEREQKKLKQYYKKQNAALEKHYKATLANKKLALRALGGQTVGVQTNTVSTATAIYDANRKHKIIIDKRLEAWNNWVTFYGVDDDESNVLDPVSGWVGVTFFFAWRNPTNGRVVVRANAELGLRGRCDVTVYPHTVTGGDASLMLRATLKAYPGNSQGGVWGRPNEILWLSAEAGPGLYNTQKSDGRELDAAAYVTLDHLLVGREESVIFTVDVEFFYWLRNGAVYIEFFPGSPQNPYANHKLICPALVIEWGSEPQMGSG